MIIYSITTHSSWRSRHHNRYKYPSPLSLHLWARPRDTWSPPLEATTLSSPSWGVASDTEAQILILARTEREMLRYNRRDTPQTLQEIWSAALKLWSRQRMTSGSFDWSLWVESGIKLSAYLTVICLLLHIQYSLFLLTFGSLEAVKFDRLDVDDQVGHFLCSECLTACCALHMEAHILKNVQIQSSRNVTKKVC